jgi:hypothetical protein
VHNLGSPGKGTSPDQIRVAIDGEDCIKYARILHPTKQDGPR